MRLPRTLRIRLTKRQIGQILASVLIVTILWLHSANEEPAPGTRDTADSPAIFNGLIERAFANRDSNVLVTVEGRVTRLLEDDRDGARHQRFIVELGSGHTVLVAHNIDIAPRVSDLQRGKLIALRGEYEWNDLGGVVHWTHHDPEGVHAHGWVEYTGVRYD